jgi:putative membrane protein
MMLAGAVLGALVLGGCRSNERSTAGTTTTATGARTADTSPAAGMPMGMATSDTARAKADTGAALSDANIVALLDEANKADSAAGAFASKRAASRDVKAFAAMMMSDHHALRVQGQKLAKQLNITPQPPANNPVAGLARAEMDTLRAAGKGAQFDRAYIEQEVVAHKAVLDLAGKAHSETNTAQLKALIEKAKPLIERHLARAEALQKQLGKPHA